MRVKVRYSKHLKCWLIQERLQSIKHGRFLELLDCVFKVYPDNRMCIWGELKDYHMRDVAILGNVIVRTGERNAFLHRDTMTPVERANRVLLAGERILVDN